MGLARVRPSLLKLSRVLLFQLDSGFRNLNSLSEAHAIPFLDNGTSVYWVAFGVPLAGAAAVV